MAEAITPSGEINIYDGEEAMKFGCILHDDGSPIVNIYFQVLEVLQATGYDIEPLRGRFSDRMFWADYDAGRGRIVDEFDLPQLEDSPEIDLFDPKNAAEFEMYLDADGNPENTIHFLVIYSLQDSGYDIEPLRGNLSPDSYWDDFGDFIEQIAEEFELVQKDA